MRKEYRDDLERMVAQRRQAQEDYEWLQMIEQKGIENMDEVLKYLDLWVKGAEHYRVMGREQFNPFFYIGGVEAGREAERMYNLVRKGMKKTEKKEGMDVR